MTDLDLTAANNATWTHGPVALVNQDNTPLALPASATIHMQLRNPANSVNVALDLSIGDGLIPDRAGSALSISVPVARMLSVDAGVYDYDIIVRYQTGEVRRPVSGKVTIIQGVTR